jgi:hypothetical protein
MSYYFLSILTILNRICVNKILIAPKNYLSFYYLFVYTIYPYYNI